MKIKVHTELKVYQLGMDVWLKCISKMRRER